MPPKKRVAMSTKSSNKVDKLSVHTNTESEYKDTIEIALTQLKQIKQVCVDIYGGDEDRLLRDIKQRSKEDVLANTKDVSELTVDNNDNNNDNNIDQLNSDPITLEEINKLLPLNLNGKIKSKKKVYENLDFLLKRSELRKRRLLLEKEERSNKTGDKNRP